MLKRLSTLLLLGSLAITLGGCSPSAGGDETATPGSSSEAIPTPDPALLPDEPTDALTEVDSAQFDDGFGDLVFKVGEGPAWCTISEASGFAICELNEAAALYDPVPVPATCEYSYGYQLRIWANAPAEGDIAEFACSGGSFADASTAPILASGQKLTAGSFSCYVEDVTARCQNTVGQWVALGPEVWGMKN